MKAFIYKIFPLIPKFNYSVGKKIHAYNLQRSIPAIKRKLINERNILANIGCGANGESMGWINLDYIPYKNVNFAYDCSKELPFADKSVKFVFTEHFFEHLDYHNEAIPFLKEAYRILEDNGVVRIIIPDAGKYLRGYVAEGWGELKTTRPLNDSLFDLQMGYTYNTKMELINEVFRQSGQHKFAWDYETLEFNLKKIGFKQIKQETYKNGAYPNLCLDLKARETESLYVEAIK